MTENMGFEMTSMEYLSDRLIIVEQQHVSKTLAALKNSCE